MRFDFSRWLGGGFGMFSTVDARALRALRLSEVGAVPLALPPSLEDAAQRARMLPSEARLRDLARALAETADAAGASIRVEVWERRFDAVMQPAPRLLRAVEIIGTRARP